MTYRVHEFSLGRPIPPHQRSQLEIRLRMLPGIATAICSLNGQLSVYFYGILPVQSILKLLGSLPKEPQKTALAKSVEHTETMAMYRRDALLSFSAFIALQLLKKASPAMFLSLSLLRQAFVLFIARNLFISGIKSIVKEHRPNADTLTTTAVMASILSGRPESSLTLLALSNFAEMLTTYAAERARTHISNLLQLDQPYVWKIGPDGRESKVEIQSIHAGDRIAVHLGEKICVDGKVIEGGAAVNQASITGESIPAIKQTGTQVYAGTIVQSGQLEILVEKVGDETSLARIVHMVEDAQTRRAPIQNFADRMANMLVPISFLSALLVYGATRDWQRVLNMLFIDFSCGLKLSTATAISAAVGMAAKQGILVKGGNYIEALADIDTVVLDKTGTITIGTPKITEIQSIPEIDEKELLLLAASVEMHSIHPLAAAIQQHVKEHGWEIPHHLFSETVIARGMRGIVTDFENYRGGEVLVGSYRFMQENQVAGLDLLQPARKDAGVNLLYIARDAQCIGLLTIYDPIRPSFKKALNQLRRQGIDEVIMLTGDSKSAAEHVAQVLDFDDYYAEVFPEEKATVVTRLQKRGHVLMVGDGVNDAPALAFADVGITLGGSRTDIAVESSSVTINSDDPLKLSEVVRLGNDTMRLVRQNFSATIAINTCAMLLGALGKIHPIVAAVIHNAATVGVVLNGARILLPKQNILQALRR